ncbi:hypothetical protein DHEL01_v208733 [Diaporthe helianthi]|uniref:Uncharacterized protein n=1 Tax=Diaporthe helianthi TaxID=158607 RepID=A0A2P5HRJ1_DIAHE|nr:hypothetical protein DHEL01_v208733 [Diaporthe helianthi]
MQPSAATAVESGKPMHPPGPWGLSLPALECDCGVTAEEAITRGCRFFENELRWLQPDCHDQKLDDVFRAHAPWKDGWHYEVHFDDNGTFREVSKLAHVSFALDDF